MNVLTNKKFYEEKGFGLWSEKSFKQDRVIKLFNLLSSLLKSEKSLNVLDIACGTGEFIGALSNLYPANSYYGSDIASNIIRQNKQRDPSINWSTEDCNKQTGYKNNFFDVVIAGEVLEHLYNTDLFIYDVTRIIKPGGTLLLTTPNLASWLDRITLLLGLQPFSTEVSNDSRTYGRKIFYKLLKLPKESGSAGHLRCFTRGALKDIFEASGYKDIKLVPCHVHNFYINAFFSRFFPQLSQNTILVAKKPL